MSLPHSPPAPRTEPDRVDAAVEAAGADPLLPLVQRAAQGEREALARLLSLIAPSIVSAVRVVAGDRVDIEDAAQEAMIAIVDSVPRFRGQSTFLHYARRIAVRTAFGMRRTSLRRSRKLAEVEMEVGGEPGDGATSAGQSQNAAIERNECLSAFQRLLDELPDGQAESLTYRVLLEYPLPVIARELKVPVNTVRSRIRLARDHLRERILADPDLAEMLKDL
jgi:RNA polymerase sigma factor (sigma-70 family)